MKDSEEKHRFKITLPQMKQVKHSITLACDSEEEKALWLDCIREVQVNYKVIFCKRLGKGCKETK